MWNTCMQNVPSSIWLFIQNVTFYRSYGTHTEHCFSLLNNCWRTPSLVKILSFLLCCRKFVLIIRCGEFPTPRASPPPDWWPSSRGSPSRRCTSSTVTSSGWIHPSRLQWLTRLLFDTFPFSQNTQTNITFSRAPSLDYLPANSRLVSRNDSYYSLH